MSDHADVIRPFLFGVRLLLWISAVITLGLTAWVADHLKGYRVIFTLVISVLTAVFYIPSLFTALMHRNRGYMLPLDIIFYALWLSAFIFVAQTDGSANGVTCHYYSWDSGACRRRNSIEAFTFLSFFWTLCAMCLEIANIYLDEPAVTTHPEKTNLTAHGANNGTAAATNGAHSQV